MCLKAICEKIIKKSCDYVLAAKPFPDRNTADNMAIIRRIIYNRVKMRLSPKQHQFGKRSCMYDDDYRLKVLFFHTQELL